jgi:hypothetical protein
MRVGRRGPWQSASIRHGLARRAVSRTRRAPGGDEAAVEHLLDHGLEVVVVEEAGEIGRDSHRTEPTDAVLARCPVRLGQHGGAVDHHTGKPNRTLAGEHVNRSGRHRSQLVKPPCRWAADYERRRRETRAEACLFESHVVAPQSIHTLVHRDEEPALEQVRPMPRAELGVVELRSREYSVLSTRLRECFGRKRRMHR